MAGNLFFKVLLTVFAAVCSAKAAISGQIVNPQNGHRYALLERGTWLNSEQGAILQGGHLVTINDLAEQNWVFQTFGKYGGQSRLLWIGLNDFAKEGAYVWSSGQTSVFRRWAAGEPNNSQAGEDFVAMYYPGHSSGGMWNDWGNVDTDPIGLPFHGVVEIEPLPTWRSGDFSFVTNGLVAAYGFRQNANDSSGFANHGSAQNVEFIQDRFGTPNAAALFNGADSVVSVPSSTSLNITGTNGLTISAWINTVFPARFQAIVNKWGLGGPEDDQFWLGVQDDGVFLETDAAIVWGISDIPVATDVHVTAVYNPVTMQMQMFLNGTLNGSRPWQRNIRSTSQRMLIGNAEGLQAGFFGSLDDIRIYNRGLTEAEVLHLYEWNSSRAAWIAVNASGKMQILLQPGNQYQLESSSDLRAWEPKGPSFIAEQELTPLDLAIPTTNEFFRVRSVQ
ncbi:MAG TPA: LamG-like jellyroll fold domain-containing protein [Verrucomicrobiae bacterium]|nr:LamG-like jellyroll fold domain-containing protein [Verrucomicrobiae bacterium]